MKKVEVVAAIFIENNMLFSSQRNEGNYVGHWEFPGGKIENNESHEETIIREIREELGAKIKVKEYFDSIEHEYPEFTLKMHLYVCQFLQAPKLLEHKAIGWFDAQEIKTLKWIPADISLIPKIEKLLS